MEGIRSGGLFDEGNEDTRKRGKKTSIQQVRP